MANAKQPDYEEALRQNRKAAEEGSVTAQFNIGLAYSLGHGVTSDDVEAVRWFRMATDQGNARAAWELGMRYLIGLGVDRDKVSAYYWLSLGVRNGITSRWLRLFRIGLGMLLPKAQRTEVRRRVQDWRKSVPYKPGRVVTINNDLDSTDMAGWLEVNWGSIWKSYRISNEAALKMLDPKTAYAWAAIPGDKLNRQIDQLHRERTGKNPVISYVALPPSVIEVLLKGFEAGIADLNELDTTLDKSKNYDRLGDDILYLEGSASDLRRVLASPPSPNGGKEVSLALTQEEDDR